MEQEKQKLEENSTEEENLEAGIPAEASPSDDLTRYASPEIEDDEDDAPTEWVPSRFEKRIHAIPEGLWNLYQTLAGVAVGAFSVFALYFGGSGLSPLFLAALALALAAPNILEDRGRRRLSRFRIVLIIAIALGVIGMTAYTGATQGWDFFRKQE